MLKALKALYKLLIISAIITAGFSANVRAAPTVNLANVSGALLANAGTHYEMKTEEGKTTVSFEVLVDGIEEGDQLFFRTSTIRSDCIQSVFPSRNNLENGVPSIVSIELKPNQTEADALGEVLITYEYDLGNDAPPKATEIRITQPSGEIAPEPEPQPNEEELAIIAMLESTTSMPEVTFSGSSAELVYRHLGNMVSWNTTSSSTRLTITNVSALAWGVPLAIEGYQPTVRGVVSKNKYNVAIPSEQINYILARRADEVYNQLDGAVLRENLARTSDTYTFLTAQGIPPLPTGAAVYSEDEHINIPDSSVLEFEAETSWLAENAGTNYKFDVAVMFNGETASNRAVFTVEMSRPEFFPSVISLLAEEMLETEETPEESEVPQVETPVEEPVVLWAQPQANGLIQEYDSFRKLFVNTLYQDVSFTSNVPCGIVTNEAVTITFPEDMEFTAFLDDEPFTIVSGAKITKPGSYRMTMKVTETIVDESEIAIPENITLAELQEIQNMDLNELLEPEEVIVYEGEFSFRIVSGLTKSLVYYNPPAGYTISELKFEDVSVGDFSPDYVKLTTDGSYEFTISGKPSEPEFVTTVVRFSAKPVIELTGVYDGIATGDVFFNVRTEGAEISRVQVLLNGASLPVYGNALTAPGLYSITATDIAGNVSSTSFRLLYSVNISGWLLVFIVLAVFVALFGYMYFIRTHMRVI